MNNQSRANSIRWKGEVESQGEARSLLAQAGDTVLIKRGRPRSLVMYCPDGCGSELVVNLDSRVGPAWRMYQTRTGVTLYPSVWRESGCGSHFILWNQKIYWCDYDTLWDDSLADSVLENRAMQILRDGQWHYYEQVAEITGGIPWEILLLCRKLVKRSILEEGTGKSRGNFRIIGDCKHSAGPSGQGFSRYG